MKFNREDIKNLLVIVIFIALIVIAVRFIIELLPLIIVALIGLLVYDSVKKRGKNSKNDIKDAEVIEEKKK